MRLTNRERLQRRLIFVYYKNAIVYTFTRKISESVLISWWKIIVLANSGKFLNQNRDESSSLLGLHWL